MERTDSRADCTSDGSDYIGKRDDCTRNRRERGGDCAEYIERRDGGTSVCVRYIDDLEDYTSNRESFNAPRFAFVYGCIRA